MTRFKTVAAVLILAGAAILWNFQRENQVREHEENESLRRKLLRLVELEKDNERLSNRLAQADSRFSNDKLGQLLRLRNEVSMLRQQTNELIELREQNEQLRLALRTRSHSRSQTTNSPLEEIPLAVYPKGSWAFTGFATPEDTLLSMIWAGSTGDIQTFLACLAPDAQQEFARDLSNMSESELAEKIKGDCNKIAEVRILKKEAISDSEVVLTLQSDEEGGAVSSSGKTVFRKMNDQWKVVSPNNDPRRRASSPQKN